MDQTNGKQMQRGLMILQGIAQDIAAKSRITLSMVQVDDGVKFGCRDFHILTLSTRGKYVSMKICQKEFKSFSDGIETDEIRLKIHHAVARLRNKFIASSIKYSCKPV